MASPPAPESPPPSTAPAPAPKPKKAAKKRAFPKANRLRKRPEFLGVQTKGIKASGQWLTALAKKNPMRRRRLGVTVSTKVGNSVLRSKVKRWLREAFRLHPEWVPDGIDLVLIARPGIDKADWAAVLKDYERLGKALKAKMPVR